MIEDEMTIFDEAVPEDDLPYGTIPEEDLEKPDPTDEDDPAFEGLKKRMKEAPEKRAAMDPEPSMPRPHHVFHVKLASNFQTVELDYTGDGRSLYQAVELVNWLGSHVVNSDKAGAEKKKEQKRDPDQPEMASDRQIEALYRALGGSRSTYAKWTREQAWGTLNSLQQQGLLPPKEGGRKR